jgi:hypothetical protein
VHLILIKPVVSNHLSYVTIFQCTLGRSHKTGLTVDDSPFSFGIKIIHLLIKTKDDSPFIVWNINDSNVAF